MHKFDEKLLFGKKKKFRKKFYSDVVSVWTGFNNFEIVLWIFYYLVLWLFLGDLIYRRFNLLLLAIDHYLICFIKIDKKLKKKIKISLIRGWSKDFFVVDSLK